MARSDPETYNHLHSISTCAKTATNPPVERPRQQGTHRRPERWHTLQDCAESSRDPCACHRRPNAGPATGQTLRHDAALAASLAAAAAAAAASSASTTATSLRPRLDEWYSSLGELWPVCTGSERFRVCVAEGAIYGLHRWARRTTRAAIDASARVI